MSGSRSVATRALVGLALILAAAWTSSADRNGTAAIQCVDVAEARGLTFRGAYGSVVEDRDQMARMMERNMGNGVAVGDYDRSGYLSVYLLGQNGHPSKLFRNEPDAGGKRRFSDVTEAAGLGGQRGQSRVAFFVDLDGDGWLDLVVINDRDTDGRLPPSKIYRNNRDGTFSDVTSRSGFDPVGYIVGGAAFADFNKDGLPDLYISYWTKNMGRTPAAGADRVADQFPGRNRLYRNLGGFRFQDVTEEVGLGVLAIDTFTPVFADLSGGGYPDIYLPADFGERDRFFQNLGRRFRDASREFGVGHAGNDMGVAVADLDGDGLLELYITGITDPSGKHGVNPGNVLLRRKGHGHAVYEDHAAELGVRDTAWGWGTAFVDVDLDGHLDIYTVQGFHEFVGSSSPALRNARAVLFRNDGKNRFAPTRGTGCEVEGDQRALVVLDYNRDGAPDLLITQVNGPTRLLENRTTPRGRWLTIACDGRGSRCIGARVYLTIGGRTTGQVLLAGGSYLAGPPLEAYFGLGANPRADELRIVWPSGQETVLRQVAADQVIRIVAPPVSDEDSLPP